MEGTISLQLFLKFMGEKFFGTIQLENFDFLIKKIFNVKTECTKDS